MAKTKLQIAREEKKLSILALSKLCGVSHEKIRQLEDNYRVEGTRYEIKERIAHCLGKNTWALFPDVEDLILRMQKEKEALFAKKKTEERSDAETE